MNGIGHAIARLDIPRHLVLPVALMAGCFFIAVLTIVFIRGSNAAVLVLDYSNYSIFPYPFTIQNLMYLFFFACLGELLARYQCAQRELGFLGQGYLPEDTQTVLQVHELGPIRMRVAERHDGENGFLPYLIDLSILQFQSSRSVDQVVSVLNSSLELISHRVDLRYSMIRYIVWVIPTIGFIGTVVGIAGALGFVNPEHMDLGKVTSSLAIAFNTTIIALVLSAILVFLLHVVQKREEMAVNLSGDYCLRNLINRLYAGDAAQ